MSEVAIIYDKQNKLKMRNIHSSLQYQFDDYEIDFISKPKEYHKVIVTDKCQFFGKKAVLVVSKYNQKITKGMVNKPVLVQYESEAIKDSVNKINGDKVNNFGELYDIDFIIAQAIPKQKYKIEPLKTQNSTIFYQGKDKPEDMVDSMFDLDTKTHFQILFYSDSEKEPSKKHKLSWCVSKDKNTIGIINHKIIKEIENGCLPILIKEYMPKSFGSYPFYIPLIALEDKDALINRVKEISALIAKMDGDDFASLANAIYSGIYVNSSWKLNYYKISERIKLFI